jgi:predicted ATPase with chaperone activity
MSTAELLEAETVEASPPVYPPIPETISDTGLSETQITDLLLKILYQQGALMGDDLADIIALPFGLIDELLLTAQQRRFVEVLQAFGHGRGGYTFDLTQEGRTRAAAALEASRYVGAAPVPLDQFRQWAMRQSVRGQKVGRDELHAAFGDLVLPEEALDALGPAVNSGGSIFLHGAPGNGKTSIAERLGVLTSSTLYVPRAVMIEGHVMVLFDPIYHHPVDDEPRKEGSTLFRDGPVHDTRFVRVRRPTVLVGGDLTMDQLDLQYDPYSKVYQAPFQLKAAGGVLVIDDFGRQRMRPAELLNRWIVPLEKGFDNLTLHSGLKFPVPFDSILIFATNLDPRDLVEEAFLRRIQVKVEVTSPDRAAFEQIMRLTCEEVGVPFSVDAVDVLFDEYYNAHDIAPRGCHPRDILHHVTSIAAFLGVEPELGGDLLRRAVGSYFMVMEEFHAE